MSRKIVYVAGGCFWGVEKYFGLQKGIIDTTVGYLNSKKVDPSYEDVCNNLTDAVEAVELVYDSNVINLKTIVNLLFKIINPTTLNKQGNDIGSQYRTGIYSDNENDIKEIYQQVQGLQKNYQSPIVTEVLLKHNFYIAEEYHQDYLKKNPHGYCHINFKE